MFGQQQGGFPAAAGQPPSGGSRGSVFGGSAPGGSGGPPSAASVFGGQVPGRSGTAAFPSPSVFGGSAQHGGAAASGPALSAAAVFGSSQPTAARSVFGANPVAATTPSGAGAVAFFGQQQQQVAAKSFFGSLPSASSATQRPAAAGQQLNSGGVGLSTVVSVPAAGSSGGGVPPASPSSVFGAHARSASRQPFAEQHDAASPSVFGSQPAPAMVLAGGGGQQQQNASLVSLASGQSGGSAMPLSSAPASVLFGRAGAVVATTAGAALASAGSSGLAQSMPGPATSPASAHPGQPPVPVSVLAPVGLLFGKAVASGVTAGSAAPAAGGSPSTLQTAALQLAGLMRPLYSEIADLSEDELAQFKASHFTVDNIPLKPPPRQLVH